MSLNSLHKRMEWILRIPDKLDQLQTSGLFDQVSAQNPWFTPGFTDLAARAWKHALAGDLVKEWIKSYPHLIDGQADITVLVVMAGNLPLVGLHDLLCAFVCGGQVEVKISSKDPLLIPALLESMQADYPDTTKRIRISPSLPDHPDAVLASGSDHSMHFFSSRYAGIPAILRGNRHAAAVLTGEESDAELIKLRQDILAYHGLGCRNVSLILAPDTHTVGRLARLMRSMPPLELHAGYFRNLAQQKALLNMNQAVTEDAGQFILTPSSLLSAPMGVVHYRLWSNEEDIENYLQAHRDRIQCLVSKRPYANLDVVEAGQAQFPALTDYADQQDTLAFLSSLLPG